MVGEYRFEVSWAARQASPHWATVMSASGGGVISAACFKLAIVDKALEVCVSSCLTVASSSLTTGKQRNPHV